MLNGICAALSTLVLFIRLVKVIVQIILNIAVTCFLSLLIVAYTKVRDIWNQLGSCLRGCLQKIWVSYFLK